MQTSGLSLTDRTTLESGFCLKISGKNVVEGKSTVLCIAGPSPLSKILQVRRESRDTAAGPVVHCGCCARWPFRNHLPIYVQASNLSNFSQVQNHVAEYEGVR